MNKQEIEKAIEYFRAGNFLGKSMDKHINVAISALEQQLTNGWTPVSEKLPKSDSPVLATARYKVGARGYFIYKACYVAPKTKTTEDYGWDTDNVDGEYDEEKDCYWIPECWFEDNAVEDNANWILDDDFDVLAWRELPEPYRDDIYKINDAMFQCRHALSGKINDIGEIILHCEITDNFENVTLGNCIGNCEYQEMEG